jgi:peptidyl-prolyl cis-trans isomerase D
MRAHATSWFIKIIIGAIIVVFVLYFGGQRQERKKTIVVTVGDRYIGIGDFNREYQRMLENYKKLFGQQLSPDLLKGLNIKQQVLDQLINADVMQQGAQNIGLRVSDEELKQAILQYPAFQREGAFDRYLYEDFLRSNGYDNEKFLQVFKRDLMNQFFMEIFGDTAVILSDEEVKDLYALENGKINLSFVKVSPQALVKHVTVTQDKLEQYYAEHKEGFLAPAEVKVVYLRFSPNAYQKEVQVSPQEVQQYYDTNREQYHRPERVRISHILIRVSPTASPDAVEKARLKAERVRAEARGGANFAALARKNSDDSSAAKGGDLGYFARGEIDPALGKVVFNLRKGEISPVVRSSRGFHIIKVEDVQAGKTRTVDAAKKEIIAYLLNEKAKDLAAIHAEDAAYQAKKKGGLKSYADEARLQVLQGGPFKAGEPASKGKLPSVAFTLERGEISSAFQDGEDYFVLQVVDKIPPQILPLEKVKARVQEALVSSLSRQLAQGIVRDLLATWRKGSGFGDLMGRYGLKVEETGFFKRNLSSPPRIGPLGEYVGKIATLTLEDPWPEDIAEVNNSFVVVKLKDVEKVDEREYVKAGDAFRTQLDSYKARELLQGWLTVMKKKVKIEVNQELIGEKG